MNGVDYTKQLAKDREYFRDSAQKTKAATDKLVSDTNDRADHVMQKQKETFIEDKAELENSYQKKLNHLQEKTAEAIDTVKTKKREELEKAKADFATDADTKRKDFAQRLSDIKSSYNKNLASQKEHSEDLAANKQKNYSRNIDELRASQEKQLQGYQKKLTGAGAGLKDEFRREKEQLVRDNEEHVNYLNRQKFKDEAALKEKLNTNLQKTKEVAQAEKEQLRKFADNRLITAERTFSDKATKLSSDYSKKHGDLAKVQQEEALKTNRAHQHHVEDMQRGFNKRLQEFKDQKERSDAGATGLGGLMAEQTANKDVDVQKARVKDLQNKLEETRMTYHDRSQLEEREHYQTLKDEAAAATANLDKKTREMTEDKVTTIAKDRAKALQQLTNREQQNAISTAAYERQIMQERTQANERLTNLKESFNKSMKTLEEQSRTNLEDVTKVANEDKAKFIKKANEAHTNELYGMKREFEKTMDSIVEGYEQRLGKYQKENETLKLTMDQKLQEVTAKKDRELETHHKMAEDRRIAEARSHQLILDQREHKLRSSINHLTATFKQKMDVMQANNDTKLKLLTDDYESKLKELTVSKTKELAEKDMNQSVEVERLKQIYEDEKARLIYSYENQIHGLKVSHKDQMDQLKDIKRIG